MEWQALTVRRKALQDQLLEDGYDLNGVLATLTAQASEREAEEELERINARIQRLGAINLAAIDEYTQQSERKRYLDAQDADLVEALETPKTSSARSIRKPATVSKIPLIRSTVVCRHFSRKFSVAGARIWN